MIDDTMYRLVGRNAVVVGATVAAVLLTMQLRTSGVDSYAPADVLSILLIAVPVMTRAVRPQPRQRSGPPRDAEAGELGRDDHPRPSPRPSRMDTEAARTIERMLVRGVAFALMVGAWLLAAVLVLLQAWAPAVSALIVFGVAAAGVPAQVEDAPVALSPGDGAG
jgi:hypothetical protein